jgi:hypothetical protein
VRSQLGRVALERGDHDTAATILDGVVTDAHALGLTVSLPLPLGLLGRALLERGDLALLAARAGIRDLLARAHLHRHALGDADGLAAARIAAPDVDSPVLAAAIANAAAAAPAPRDLVA